MKYKQPGETGQDAEAFAREYLINVGLRFIMGNYRTKVGEIDLIMMDKQSLVFVEVRLRNHSHDTAAIESIDYFKQQRLLRTAECYLISTFKNNPPPCRFDATAAGEPIGLLVVEQLVIHYFSSWMELYSIPFA
jgi:putative endonuclease